MGDGTGISWTDTTWNPLRGCSRVSEGCRHCYAETQAARIVRMGNGKPTPYDGLVKLVSGEARWTGEVRLIAGHLADPLRWRKPRRIFVNSMSDLFHESLSNEQIAAVFAIMAGAPQHTFQVLTKRAKRMREWFAWIASSTDIGGTLMHALGSEEYGFDDDFLCTISNVVNGYSRWAHDPRGGEPRKQWPLPNVWLGVSVEHQAAADERIPDLLATPAAVRFLSCEPLLGTIQLKPFTVGAGTYCFDCGGAGVKVDEDGCCATCGADAAWFGVDWVIAGCESGPGARPCDVAWLRSLRDQCAAPGVAFFAKQAKPVDGEYTITDRRPVPIVAGRLGELIPVISEGPGSKRKAGGVIELPYLDGVQHAAFPRIGP